MTAPPTFDTARAHRFFSVECFNRAWDLIEKDPRSPEEDERMLMLSHASLWHWMEREDCTARNLSIGHWQLSRVHALLGQSGNSTRHAELSLQHGVNEPPFYIGYAHEALARAAMVAGDRERMIRHQDQAKRHAEQVEEADERSLLEKDLESIR